MGFLVPSTEIVEQLARRLCDVRPFVTEGEKGVKWDDLAGFHKTQQAYLDIARECLRQMEWARNGWVVRIDSNGSRFYSEAPPESELTLAPEDWTPYAE